MAWTDWEVWHPQVLLGRCIFLAEVGCQAAAAFFTSSWQFVRRHEYVNIAVYIFFIVFWID